MQLKKLTSDSFITGSVNIFRLCSQFFVLPFLARHLSPEDYGVIAIATPFILFSVMFARSGIEAPLLRDKERDPKIWSSSFWFVSFSGLFFTLLIVAAAPIMAWFFETPQLFPILAGMSLGILLQGLSIIPMAQLRHQHRFKLLSGVQMIAIFSGLAAAVIVAANGGGAWAIVLQGIVIHGLTLVLVFIASKFKPQFFFKLKLIKDHIAFGYTVMGTTFIDFLKDAIRPFIIAKVLGTALVGFYSIAFLFLNLPYRIINAVMQTVIYAYLAKLRDNEALLRSMLLLIIRCLAIVVIPAMIMVAVAHDPVFHILLSEQWALSGQLYALAAPAAALFAILNVRTIFMQIIGKVRHNFRYSIELLILQAILLLIFVWHGIEWAMMGIAFAMYLYLPRQLWVMHQYFKCSPLNIMKVIAPTCLVTCFGALGYWALADVLAHSQPLHLMLLAIGIGVVVLLACIAVQYKSMKKEIFVLKGLLDQKG